MERTFKVFNGVAPTTAQQLAVTSGTAIKTLLQLATPSTKGLTIVAWGITHDGHAAATSVSCELLTCTGAATVTTLAAGDVANMTHPLDEASLLTFGTSATGFTASGEGTAASVDVLDSVYLTPTQADRHVMQWPLGREPVCALSRFVRVRVTVAGNAVNMRCWVELGM